MAILITVRFVNHFPKKSYLFVPFYCHNVTEKGSNKIFIFLIILFLFETGP